MQKVRNAEGIHYLIMDVVVHEVSQGDSYDYTFTGKRSRTGDILEPIIRTMPGLRAKSVKKGSKPYRKPRSAKPDRNFVKKVKAIIAKDVETKEASIEVNNKLYNGIVNNVIDITSVMPNISQGTDDGERIGKEIRAQKISFKGHFYINATPNSNGGVNVPTAIPANCRLLVRAFVFSVKRFGSFADASATTAWMTSFLKNGSGTQALDGTVKSMYLPVNTDVITVHKEFLEEVNIPAIIGQTATAIGFSNVAVSFEKTLKFMMADFYIKKRVVYDDISFQPQNFAPLFCLSYAHIDDSTADLIETRINASYVSTLSYEDA